MSSDPHAVLDIGSNTIRLLVARFDGKGLQPIADESEFVRLGLGVDKTGSLDPERQEAALQAIETLARHAHEQGAGQVTALATSAVRDATNGGDFARRVRESTGVDVEVISGDREAYLTYLGATLGVRIDAGAIVCDLGGGSAELIHADSSGLRWATSVPLGSGRLTERFIHHDPPAAEELDQLSRYVRTILDGLAPAQAESAIFTGGTATHVAWLAGLDKPIETVDPATLDRVLEILTTQPAAKIVSTYGIKEARAQVLPAGVKALQTIAQYYGAGTIVITRNGIREGAIIDALKRKGTWVEPQGGPPSG